MGLDDRFSRPDRVRAWKYEFDPSGLELLRRAIEHVQLERLAASEAAPVGGPPAPVGAGR